ncbi:cysteine--tRNA ligase [Leifsonia bigeumensis]|uniref:Cysteine--tRNA ligase n=1 Tax=Leifsonella bigeumensis TaxID=433643 RepID=A0ABP7F9C8_9MICO
MTVRLYDSRSQTVNDLVPLVDGEVGMYVCGPTVQSSPHIGHLRSALVYDLWRRWLGYRGYRVTLVRNVTDIDDKILASATAEGSAEQWWALAYRFELEFTAGYTALGILPPTYEPRATASIGQMQEIIQHLIDAGHAYPAPDASGDVYFDTGSWPAYGELTRQKPEDMAPAADADPRGKREPRDFALWKGHKTDEPESASWPSPWGPGRPGWHIECSAMASRYLGSRFDIHGGGLDLRFPHHENELAQSTAAGDGFANYWVHNGLVNVEGQKMSKSLGNSIFASEFLRQARPIVVRYYLGSAHYRSTIDYHDGALVEAEAALERIEVFLERVDRRLDGTPFAGSGALVVPDAFAAAMDDDLAVPQALAVLHDRVRAGNAALDADDLAAAAAIRGEVFAMTDVLGINPLAHPWREAATDAAAPALSRLVERLIGDREAARAAKDFAAADRIRDELSEAGIQLEDSPTGTHWSIA